MTVNSKIIVRILIAFQYASFSSLLIRALLMADTASQLDLRMTLLDINLSTSSFSTPSLSCSNLALGQKHKRCRTQIKARTRIRRLKR